MPQKWRDRFQITNIQYRQGEKLLDLWCKDRVQRKVFSSRSELGLDAEELELTDFYADIDREAVDNLQNILKDKEKAQIINDFTAWFCIELNLYRKVYESAIHFLLFFNSIQQQELFGDAFLNLSSFENEKEEPHFEELRESYPFQIYFSPDTPLDELKKYIDTNGERIRSAQLNYSNNTKIKRIKTKTLRTRDNFIYVMRRRGLSYNEIFKRLPSEYGDAPDQGSMGKINSIETKRRRL